MYASVRVRHINVTYSCIYQILDATGHATGTLGHRIVCTRMCICEYASDLSRMFAGGSRTILVDSPPALAGGLDLVVVCAQAGQVFHRVWPTGYHMVTVCGFLWASAARRVLPYMRAAVPVPAEHLLPNLVPPGWQGGSTPAAVFHAQPMRAGMCVCPSRRARITRCLPSRTR